MNLLKRELAPISTTAWQLIEEEAKAILPVRLGGRKIVDFDGPHGWEMAAVNTGRITAGQMRPNGFHVGSHVEATIRDVVPLVEVRVPFTLAISELDAAERGAEDINLDALTDAAIQIAAVENNIIFNGLDVPPMKGILSHTEHDVVSLSNEAEGYLQAVVDAEMVMQQAGIGGPYALALGPKAYEQLTAATDDGYPVRRSLSPIIDGPIVWVPELDGAVLISLRGGDFELSVGQDLSIGYRAHDRESVELYLVESLAFRVIDGAAAVYLQHPN